MSGQSGKIFSQRATLTRDHPVHTGERPYEFGECAKPLGTNPNLIVRELTLGKGPMSVLKVGNSSGRATVLLNTREHIPAQGLMGAANAESPLVGGLPLLNIRAFTLGCGIMPVVNAGNPSVEAAALPNIAELTLGKGYMSVTSVESHLGKSVLNTK